MSDDFKKRTDLLTGAFSQRELAEALGVDIQHFRQMRLSADSRGRRPPPANWREILAPYVARLRSQLDALEDD